MKFLSCLRKQGTPPIYPSFLRILNRSASAYAFITAKSIPSHLLTVSASSDVALAANVVNVDGNSNVFLNAGEAFGEMPEWNVVSWTSMISNNAKRGFSDRALGYFLRMQRDGIEPNEMTFSTVVGICSRFGNTCFGTSLHCLILKKGLSGQSFIASGLVSMYSKCNLVDEAWMIFDELPKRDAVLWNSMIVGYAQNSLNIEALNLFSMMLANDIYWISLVNGFIVTSVLKACARLGCITTGKSIHCQVIKLNFSFDVFVLATMIDMYSRCGCLDSARCIFNQMGKQDLVVWNSMITGYAQNSSSEDAIKLFNQLQSDGFLPNQTTFASVLKALAEIADNVLGRSFHARILKGGFLSDVFVGTALVDVYSKCLNIEDAECVFKEIERKNLVSFNALIAGYSPIGRYKDALKIYTKLQRENMRPDAFTLSGVLSSCSVMGALSEGTEVHAHSIKLGLDLNTSVGNSLISLYSNCSLTDSALKVFESLTMPNNMSWAGIISGFAQNGDGENALKHFRRMLSMSIKPDEFSFSSILKVLAGWAATVHGRHMHAMVIKTGLESNLVVGSALVDMYSKCGIVEDSFRVFANMPEKNVISWNSMIMGFAQNGFSETSLCLFEDMKKLEVIPTSVTFLGLLLACGHAGWISKGRYFFDMMISYYGISPSVEHCTCIVDLLGRPGHLEEAESFLMNSPFASEPSIWKSLLAACSVHKNSAIGIRVAERCLQLEPYDPSTYVLLSNIYASNCLWPEVARIRNLMRDLGVEKETGCSWIGI